MAQTYPNKVKDIKLQGDQLLMWEGKTNLDLMSPGGSEPPIGKTLKKLTCLQELGIITKSFPLPKQEVETVDNFFTQVWGEPSQPG